MEDAGLPAEPVGDLTCDEVFMSAYIRKTWKFKIGQRVAQKYGDAISIVRFRDRYVGNREIYGVDAPDDDRGLRFLWGDTLKKA